MSEEKKNLKKANKKDSQLLIRISAKERDDFIQLCEQLDTSAARELRSFIRSFIKKQRKQLNSLSESGENNVKVSEETNQNLQK
ncbi:hypothetical protein VQ643_14235 [Pseudomonas sp. F1_0610]|uniref:hypothetical protein n=1 Tax=Pseudomonas sp. F1_0610 TaxID=3114284 RepID=UPI0039C4A0F6